MFSSFAVRWALSATVNTDTNNNSNNNNNDNNSKVFLSSWSRLLLLLQSSGSYVEQLRCSHRREQTQQKGCLSVGLVVRNYWSNLVDFACLTVCILYLLEEDFNRKWMNPITLSCFFFCVLGPRQSHQETDKTKDIWLWWDRDSVVCFSPNELKEW